MEIEMLLVYSTLIRAIGHDPQNNVLRVEFKDGAQWEYADVDAEKYDRMRNADSVGRFFHSEIKGNHTATAVPPPSQDDTQ